MRWLVERTRTVCIARAPETSAAMAVPWAGGSRGGAAEGAGGGGVCAAALPATSSENTRARISTASPPQFLPSLRGAQRRSNPVLHHRRSGCFAALAMTTLVGPSLPREAAEEAVGVPAGPRVGIGDAQRQRCDEIVQADLVV